MKMKIRNMFTDYSAEKDVFDSHCDHHTETIQDGYDYRLSVILEKYTHDELLALERQSKLAFESVERKVFYDDMNPEEVERYKTLKEQEEKAKADSERKAKLLAEFESEYLKKLSEESKITNETKNDSTNVE